VALSNQILKPYIKGLPLVHLLVKLEHVQKIPVVRLLYPPLGVEGGVGEGSGGGGGGRIRV